MANRKRRKKGSAGNTWIKWLLLFWFIGALYVAFLWYIGFIGRDLSISIGVTLLIFGAVGYGLIRALLRPGPLKAPQNGLSREGDLLRTRENRFPQWIVIAFTSLAALGLLAPWSYRKFRPFPRDEVNKTVEEVNQRVMYWKMEPSQIILQSSQQSSRLRMQAGSGSFGCSEQPKAQFVISIKDLYKDSAYLFDACEYTLETGGDPTKVTTSNICDFINERYTGKYPLLEEMREASIEIPGPRGIKFTKLPAGEAAVELAYMLIKVIRASGSCAEVLVKGYADGQMVEWTRELKPGRYYYREIPIYPMIDPGSGNSFGYVHSAEMRPVPEGYTNRDLPNLRAMFVKENLIAPFLSNCNTWGNVQVSILEGYEFTKWNPLERKVQVYLVLF
jgi:hypothetical protein